MSGRAQDASSEAAPRHRGRGLGRALPGIALEALALWLLLTAEDPAGTLALFLALHGVACLLSALAARARLPRELGGSPQNALAQLAAQPRSAQSQTRIGRARSAAGGRRGRR